MMVFFGYWKMAERKNFGKCKYCKTIYHIGTKLINFKYNFGVCEISSRSSFKKKMLINSSKKIVIKNIE